jgi:hypothetical protein
MRAGVALAALLAVALAGCARSAKVERVDASDVGAPDAVRSLGLVGAWFDVRGMRGDSTVVEVALQPEEVRTYFERSLRLAWWDPSAQRFELLKSSYDRNNRTLSATTTHAGLHTVVGLSRYDRILEAQLQVSVAKNLAHDSAFVWVDCRRVLCETDSMTLIGEDPVTSVAFPFDDLCEQCTERQYRPIDFPESDLFGDPVLEVTTSPCDFVDPSGPDADGDGLSDWEELCNTRTNPAFADTDGDGLVDGWEVNGTTVNGEFVDLPALGVDPLQRDLLVEIDWMALDHNQDGNPNDLEPDATALAKAVQVFADQDVRLIIHGMNGFSAVDGEAMVDTLFLQDGYGLANWADYGYTNFSAIYDAVMAANATPATRAGYSRYCLWVDAYDSEKSSGLTEIVLAFDFGMQFIVSLGYTFDTYGGEPHHQLGVFLHELGHTLGLHHSGANEILATTTRYSWKNFEPNYPSVMNYFHTVQGVAGAWSHHLRSENDNDPSACDGTYQGILCFNGPAPSARVFDYSHGGRTAIDENALDAMAWTTLGFASPDNWGRYGTANGAGSWKVNLQYDWIYKWNGQWVPDVEQFDVQTDWDDWTEMQLKNW